MTIPVGVSNENDHSGRWLDLLVLFVILTSIAAVLLLVLDVFVPKVAVLIGAIGSAAIVAMAGRSGTRPIAALAHPSSLGWGGLFAVLLFALLFRFEFFPWIHGGQDQGVYYSMSAHYQHGGTLFFDDPVLAAVSHDEELAATYVEHNRSRGAFQPGVYITESGGYVFQFYHLHPLWMAIFADMFGDHARGASVVAFGLLSILFLSLLTFELSGTKYAAYAVGLLLAVNPLHAFFSKWPVTEVVTLAFSSMSLYYLARAYALRAQNSRATRAGCLAALALSLLFFVRISGFVYLPFLAATFLTGVWLQRVEQRHIGRVLMGFALFSMVAYIVSVGYGLLYSPNYSLDIYRLTFGKLFGVQWPYIASLLLAGMMAVMAAGYVYLPSSVRTGYCPLARWPAVLTKCLLVVAVLAAGFSLYKVYLLGYTGHYQDDAWLGRQWGLSQSGVGAIVRSSVLNWALYSSPLVLLWGVWAVWLRRTDLRQMLLLVLMLAPFVIYVVGNPVLPYQYYYARYLVSEAVPYAIVLCIGAAAAAVPKRRVWLTAILLFSGLVSGAITVTQWGAEEGRKSIEVLRKLSSRLGEKDALILNTAGWSVSRNTVATPLRLYFGLSTFMMRPDAWAKYTDRLDQNYDQVWLLSPQPIQDDRFELVDRVTYGDKIMERVGHLPLKVIDSDNEQKLFLYVLRNSLRSDGAPPYRLGLQHYDVSKKAVAVASVLGPGWFAVEPTRVWSTDHAQMTLRRDAFGSKYVPDTVLFDLAAYGAAIGSPVELLVQVGNQTVQTVFETPERKRVVVPVNFASDQENLVLRFAVRGASSPASRGASSDTRLLGVALFGFEFKKGRP